MKPCVYPSSEINAALARSYRIYLSGHLGNPEFGINYLDVTPECGFSQYDSYAADRPHFHKYNYEFNYIIKGQTKVLYIDTMEEFLIPEGGLFIIQPNQPYVTKHQPDTRVIFFKSPGGNDKELIEQTSELEKWMSEW